MLLCRLLFVEYNADDQQLITECVNSILQRSDHIREQIEWQETVDKQKLDYLDQEHLYTDYYETEEQKNKRISCLPPYESPPPYREPINREQRETTSLFTPEEEKVPPMDNIYRNFQLEGGESVRVRKEISVRPTLLPPEFIRSQLVHFLQFLIP